jgi:ubiquinone/menaquinone biosynthesis C-methylase UbiE|tara:strand:+ start:232 stop:1044 length:813 start_codon:yes stop_codon:yes gene_type:complete
MGFKRMKNLLNCENLKLAKNYFKNKICADFGCGSTGAGGLNLLDLGAGYVHLIDLDKHIKNPINYNLKKYKGKYQIDVGSIENTPYKKNYFDFILCQGVLHHMDNDIQGLKEIYRTLKKGGKSLLTVEGSGGLLNKFLIEVIRPEFKNNQKIRNFLTKIMSGNLKNYEKFMFNHYNSETKKIVNFLLKYLDQDLILTIRDRILAQKYKTYNEEALRKILSNIGFINNYRIKKKVKYNNIRRIVAPLYYDYSHQISRALYGEGVISLIATK